MILGIIGTGAMGKTLQAYATEEGTFEEILMIEPTKREDWERLQQGRKPDLLIDFSAPQAIGAIYDYCRAMGGNIPVVLATTGYSPEEEKSIELLEKICPVDRSSNYSQGIAVMCELCQTAAARLSGKADVRLSEIHHTKKKDAPSGTAVTLGRAAGIYGKGNDAENDAVVSLRMGTVFGTHTVYFALEDEILEIRHTAFSKRIFAIGALHAGKALLGIDEMR